MIRKKVNVDFSALTEELGLSAEEAKQLKLLFDNDARKLEDIINARSKTEDTEYSLGVGGSGGNLLILYIDSVAGEESGTSDVYVYPDADVFTETDVWLTVGGTHLDELIPLEYGKPLSYPEDWQTLNDGVITDVNTGEALQIARLDANGRVIGGGICTVSAKS